MVLFSRRFTSPPSFVHTISSVEWSESEFEREDNSGNINRAVVTRIQASQRSHIIYRLRRLRRLTYLILLERSEDYRDNDGTSRWIELTYSVQRHLPLNPSFESGLYRQCVRYPREQKSPMVLLLEPYISQTSSSFTSVNLPNVNIDTSAALVPAIEPRP
jgi:hypothetical protein